ncbi:MAG: NAD(+) diphosphatase [Pseudomonadota bacterium]|nr:NAD(+) diphosphatase [Pseudomonadota bacterium]
MENSVLHNIFFSGGKINRQNWLSADEELLERKRNSRSARFLIICGSNFLIEGKSPLLLRSEKTESIINHNYAIYLGNLDEQDIFVLSISEKHSIHSSFLKAKASFRALANELSENHAALLAYAKGMIEWYRRQNFCGLCGSPTIPKHGGKIMQCQSFECNHLIFPRLDPAIIVLVTDGKSCLLGRQFDWPKRSFSTLAGFVEPGESLEDAVKREVYEETTIQIKKIAYLGSQPWPFLSSLMIGFQAEAMTKNINLLDKELAEADWFNRDDISSGRVILPPKNSIAYRLIENWFDAKEGYHLEAFDVSRPFENNKETNNQ